MPIPKNKYQDILFYKVNKLIEYAGRIKWRMGYNEG